MHLPFQSPDISLCPFAHHKELVALLPYRFLFNTGVLFQTLFNFGSFLLLMSIHYVFKIQVSMVTKL